MPTKIAQYLGFEIEASYRSGGDGYIPTVVIRKHRGDGVKEMRLTPPAPERGYATEAKAFDVAIDYAKLVIEGRVPSADVSQL
jgi:hypothetical protein